MWDRHSLQRGMKVRGSDGRRTGKIDWLGEGWVLIRQPGGRHFTVSLGEVAGIRRGVATLAPGAQLSPWDAPALPHPRTTVLPLPP